MNWEVIGLEMDIKKAVIRIELEPFLVVKKRPLSKLSLGKLNLQLFMN